MISWGEVRRAILFIGTYFLLYNDESKSNNLER